ncbi:hypothetical protein AX17_007340 [Amanita inopinata Kibby_2008]|nr:hypothetical protein AX17_007340 [Amanita inopinata Kibby_2008]
MAPSNQIDIANVNGQGEDVHHDKHFLRPNSSHESLSWLPTTDKPDESEQKPRSILRNGDDRGSRRRSRTVSPSRCSMAVNRNVITSDETPNSATDPNVAGNGDDSQPVKRSASVGRAGSISKRSIFTNNEGYPITGSTFTHGAGTTGPNAVAAYNDELYLRAASADTALTSEQKSRVSKVEAKEGKRLSKIIKQEGKVERKALSVAINELAELQALQRSAVREEEKVHYVHSKALANLRKQERAFFAAKTKYETALAQFNAESDTLESVRNNAREATEQMQEKSQEVDSLRTMYGIDERERELKLVQLGGKKSHSLWR